MKGSIHERSFCGCGTEACMGQIRNYRYLQTVVYAKKTDQVINERTISERTFVQNLCEDVNRTNMAQ
jgi:hypothetical protein